MNLDRYPPLVGIGYNVTSCSDRNPTAPAMNQETSTVTGWSREPHNMGLYNVNAVLPGRIRHWLDHIPVE